MYQLHHAFMLLMLFTDSTGGFVASERGALLPLSLLLLCLLFLPCSLEADDDDAMILMMLLTKQLLARNSTCVLLLQLARTQLLGIP